MYIKLFFIALIPIFFTGCSSLTDIEKQQLIDYVNYSNNIIEQQFKNDQNKTIRLEPYRAHYRVAKQILQKIK